MPSCVSLETVLVNFAKTMLYLSKPWGPIIPKPVLSALPLQRYLTRRVYQRCQLDCNHSYLQRLTYLKVESLELRRIYLDLAMVHSSIRGLITADIKQHFSFAIQAPNSAVHTRGHPFKLNTTRCRLNTAHHLFLTE